MTHTQTWSKDAENSGCSGLLNDFIFGQYQDFELSSLQRCKKDDVLDFLGYSWTAALPFLTCSASPEYWNCVVKRENAGAALLWSWADVHRSKGRIGRSRGHSPMEFGSWRNWYVRVGWLLLFPGTQEIPCFWYFPVPLCGFREIILLCCLNFHYLLHPSPLKSFRGTAAAGVGPSSNLGMLDLVKAQARNETSVWEPEGPV